MPLQIVRWVFFKVGFFMGGYKLFQVTKYYIRYYKISNQNEIT